MKFIAPSNVGGICTQLAPPSDSGRASLCTWKMVRLYHLAFILHLALNGSESVDPPLPSLSTDHYSGFVEQVFVSGDLHGVKESTAVSLVWVSLR